MKQGRKAFIFEDIVKEAPQLFLWMGDNIYGDSDDPKVLAEKYQQLAEHQHYTRLTALPDLRIYGTWDDHDYGRNDAGKEFPAKAASQQAFLDFFGVPEKHGRRERAGVYSSVQFGMDEEKVRLIFLDCRYHRDEIGSGGTMLGEEQWTWLERQFSKDSDAALNILVSGIQIIPTGHRFEKWENFPEERKRLIALLDKASAPTLLLSGDRHLGEISKLESPGGRTYHEITSSSLNLPFGGNKDEINVNRLGENVRVANYGLLEIDWSANHPKVKASIRTYDRKVMAEVEIDYAPGD